MKFVDLETQQELIREKIELAIKRVMDHGHYLQGPEIGRLEYQLSQYVGAEHAVACSSGTDALVLALLALGVKRGDKVITTPFTFAATVEAIVWVGAVPVFADISPVTLNISPLHVEEILKSRDDIKGMITVDLFGLPCEYRELQALADEHGLFIVEDAAQSFGSSYRGQRCCSFGDIACTSFFPSKPLGGYGDGGMCFTNKRSLSLWMRYLLNHGQSPHRQTYKHYVPGMNARMDSFQAAVLIEKFKIFHKEVAQRNLFAERYDEVVDSSRYNLAPHFIHPSSYSTYAQYTVQAADHKGRERALQGLSGAGVPYRIYYPIPLHLQPAFKDLGYTQGDFPKAEAVADRVFSLPMHPYMTESDFNTIRAVL